MIFSIKNKPLKRFFEDNNSSKIPFGQVERIRNILTRLEFCESIEDINFPGSGLHKLSGNLKDFWAIKVNKNYRIIFKIEGNKIYDVDYIDYH